MKISVQMLELAKIVSLAKIVWHWMDELVGGWMVDLGKGLLAAIKKMNPKPENPKTRANKCSVFGSFFYCLPWL